MTVHHPRLTGAAACALTLLLTAVDPAGAASRVGTAADDVMHGTSARDRFEGRAGDDRLFGVKGRDLLVGGQGDDVLKGGRGADTLNGGPGDDVLWGGPDVDVLVTGWGDDEVRAGAGGDTIADGPGASVVHAGPGSDELYEHNDGQPDVFYCGPGYDWVQITLRRAGEPLERQDRYVECEDVYVDDPSQASRVGHGGR